MSEFVERRKQSRLAIVYLLWLDYSVLDVYEDPRLAFAEAERYIGAGNGWIAGRPGRWFNTQGRFMEIQTREIKRLEIVTAPQTFQEREAFFTDIGRP